MEKDRINTLIEILKSLKGGRPDMKNPDFSRYNQTEEDYQKEQAEWMEKVKQNKKRRKSG